MTKKCSKCKQEKDTSKFNHKGDKLTYHCKSCQNKYTRNHYKNNKADYIERAVKVKAKLRKHIQDIKSNIPCKDCGKIYPPYIMQFDHIPGKGDKIADVANMVMYSNVDKINKEIEKCEIVCANCHMERTHQRRVQKHLTPK